MTQPLGRILVLGGGGVRVPRLVHGLVSPARRLPVEDLFLYDTNAARARTMALLAAELAREAGHGVRVHVVDRPEEARAVDYVLTAIRPGGDGGRARDEALCRREGVIAQETTGAVGFFMILRTVRPLLDAVTRALAASPDAWVLNFTNPAGVMTEALVQAGVTRALGVCDTPSHLIDELAPALGLDSAALTPSYTGLNHLGFFTRLIDTAGVDRLPEVLARYEELAARVRPLSYFPAAWVRALGALPIEYVHYYRDPDGALRRQAAAGVGRGERILSWNRALWRDLDRLLPTDPAAALAAWRERMATRSATYMRVETGSPVVREVTGASYFEHEGYEAVAIAVMEGLAGATARTAVLDVATTAAGAGTGGSGGGGSGGRGGGGGGGDNGDGARAEVFELSCRVDAAGLQPLPGPPLPQAAQSLIDSVKRYERLALAAALAPSAEALQTALAAHPLVGEAAAERVLRAAAAAGVELVADVYPGARV